MNDGAVLSAWNLAAEASPTASARVTRLRTPSGCFYLKASASEGMLFWFEDHRSEIEAAIAS
jgi:hypothetical protein